MAQNKITRWIDRNNYKVCLRINRKYYKRKAKGNTNYFYFDILLYPFFIARLSLVFLQIFRFNLSLLKTYPDSKLSTFSEKLHHYLMVLFGLRYFVKEEYTPLFFRNLVPAQSLWFDVQNNPLVSIIIPVYNQLNYTIDCLRSLKLNLPENSKVEIIVANDASTDETAEIIRKIGGVRLINNPGNLGFLNSCNAAIANARGKYICLLNNDTLVLKNWLSELLATIENDESVGLVGSKLIRPFGLLQEAGGIVYNNGTCGNYGSYQDPNYFAYNYLRQTDYCTGASILFRKEDYISLNGFDKIYAPAYYEDTDFCMSIRHILKKKVVYQPLSELVHFEGVTNGKIAKKGNVKAYQVVNQTTFAKKWQKELTEYAPAKQNEVSVNRYKNQKTLVIIDSYLPRYDKESGSHRVYELIKIFKSLNLHLVFIADNGKPEQPYYNLLVGSGIEVINKYAGKLKFKKDILTATKNASYIWACRPKLNKRYQFIKTANPTAKWIYDTVDLHYVRLEREAKLTNSEKKMARAKRYKSLELSLAKKADVTIGITDVEAKLLNDEGIANTAVIPNIHALPLIENSPSFNDRKDLLFVGSYDHTPNVDAVIWLCNEIMPIIWKTNPDIKIHLTGNNPKKEVLALASDNVLVHGYVENLAPFFEQCRVFVAPLRYGAGMKGKIGQSLSYGLPTVTTNIGAEGMGLVNNQDILIANTAPDFAKAVVDAYTTNEKWTHLSIGATSAIKKYTPAQITHQIKEVLSL